VPSTEPWIRVKRQFLRAYYSINCEYARLTALRNGRQSVSSKKERSILQAIERALLAKEALEDHWASRGLIATPHQLSGLTVNVCFSHPGHTAMRRGAIIASAAVKLSFPVPWPPDGRK
jgi:hypothetical protein